LILAAEYGHTVTAKGLLQAKADIKERDVNGDESLFYAVWEGRLDTVQLLLAEKANVYSWNRGGAMPLDIAINHGRTEIESLLRSRKAAIDAPAKAAADAAAEAFARTHFPGTLEWAEHSRGSDDEISKHD